MPDKSGSSSGKKEFSVPTLDSINDLVNNIRIVADVFLTGNKGHPWYVVGNSLYLIPVIIFSLLMADRPLLNSWKNSFCSC